MRLEDRIGNLALSLPLVLIASSSAVQQPATNQALASVANQVEALVVPQAEAAVAEPFEDPVSVVGSYGPAEITLVDGALFRGDNEFYPIEGRRYYIPGSGTAMRFRRDSAGMVDVIISIGGGGQETVLPKSSGR